MEAGLTKMLAPKPKTIVPINETRPIVGRELTESKTHDTLKKVYQILHLDAQDDKGFIPEAVQEQRAQQDLRGSGIYQSLLKVHMEHA